MGARNPISLIICLLVRLFLITIVLISLVNCLFACQKKAEETKPVIAKRTAALALDEETMGMVLRLGDDVNAELGAPYRCVRSSKVEKTLAGPASPVFSYLFGDCLSATYVYREDLRSRVIQGVMLNAWMPGFAPPDKRKDNEAYFAKMVEQAQKAREKFPKVKTKLGVGIGSTKDEVLAAYGAPDKETKNGWPVYQEGNFSLFFALAKDRVVMITLMSTLGSPEVVRTIGSVGGG
jgi:hypothetical protein